VDGDWNLARGLVRSYADTDKNALATIATALAVGESLTLGEAAHVMKCASANLLALAAAGAAEQLEAAPKSGDVAQMQVCAERLKIEVAKAIAYFKAWLDLHAP
jgi:HPt (histidine-containing phosphotransfer) domain-containing protein